MDLTFRPKTAEDEPFLLEVYASTRSQEMAVTGWTVQECEDFLRGQFRAQIQSYEGNFPDATFDVVLVDGEACGRLYLDRRSDEIRILDLCLLPQFCGQGIGTKVVENLCHEAKESEKSVTAHVEKHRPRTLAFYEGIGFSSVLETAHTLLMEWKAPRIVV